MANTDFGILLKTLLDKSGIDSELEQVQKIVNKYSIDIMPELKTASLRNQMKAVSQDIANDFNKTFGTNLTGKDIFKAYENQAKQAEKAISDAQKKRLSEQEKYYTRIINNNKEIYSLKEKKLSADKEESKELQRQIANLEKKNKRAYDSISQKGLGDKDWGQQVNASKRELENRLAIKEARLRDKTNAQEQAEIERQVAEYNKQELEYRKQRAKFLEEGKRQAKEAAEIARKEQSELNERIQKGQDLAKKQANDDFLSKQSSIYGEIIETQEKIYALKKRLLSADELETEEINKQIHSLEVKNKYNRDYKLANNGMTDSSWDKIVQESKEALESQYKIADARKQDNANAKESARIAKETAQAEKERLATLEKQRVATANSAKEKAKSNAQQELAQQREINAILSKQESAYKEIWNINKQIATLDPTKNSNQISALNEKKKFYQEIYLSAQKELQAYNNITVSQEHLNSLAEIRKKTEAEISIIQGKQADVDVASKATSKEKAYQDAYTALKKLYDLRIEYAKIDNPSNNATYLYENAIKQQEQAWRKAYANTSESENWDMQKRLELQRQEVAMQEKLEHAYGRVTEAKKQSKKVDEIQHSLDVGDYDAQIETIKKGFISLSGDVNEAETHVKGLRDALQSMHDATDDNGRLNAEKSYRLELEKTDNQLTIAKAKAKEYVDVLKVQKLKNDIQDWLRKNTAATNEAKTAMTAYLNTLDDVGHVSQSSFNEAKQALDNWDTKMRVAGKLGKSFSETFKEGVKSFTSWAISSGSVMEVWNGLKNGLRTIKDLDTALVDLIKTTDATAQELEDFYYSSNETAKQLGVTTSEVINATSAWSRLGYAIEDATTLAKNSAILASISPEMDIDTATDGLVSTLKAFKIEAEDSLDGVISKINIIGNTQAVDNNDVVDILTRSSSAMAEANNTLEETIALGVAATEITRDADAVGTMLKTVSMRIRGYDEETESYTADLENLSGTIADLTKTASSPGGISLFTDETKTTYKSTYQILKDISEIYDELDDKTQAQLLEALAGKRQGQAVAAIINNFENAEKSMNSMANSAGNAMQEMEVIYDSMDYKLNQTQETATGIAQNLFGREDMKLVIDVFNDFLGLLDKATDKLGLFGTLGLGASVFAGFKNAGICV